MRRKTTLAQAADLIRRKAENYWDETFPASVIRFIDFETVEIDQKTYPMLQPAKRLVSSRLKIPFEYLKRCPSYLQAVNLNHWIETMGEKKLFLRFDGPKLRAMFTTRYRVLDNTAIVEKLLKFSYSEGKEVFLNLSDEIMVLNLPDYQRTFGILDDEVTPGMSVVNSEVGNAAFSVQAFFLRLVCTNGLITTDNTTEKIRHIRANALEGLAGRISQVGALVATSQEKMECAGHLTVKDPIATIETFNQRFKLNQPEGDMVKTAWQTEPILTMWGVINAYTRASQESAISPATAYRFEQIGGLILNLVKS